MNHIVLVAVVQGLQHFLGHSSGSLSKSNVQLNEKFRNEEKKSLTQKHIKNLFSIMMQFLQSFKHFTTRQVLSGEHVISLRLERVDHREDVGVCQQFQNAHFVIEYNTTLWVPFVNHFESN
jgi:hypothetical protein